MKKLVSTLVYTIVLSVLALGCHTTNPSGRTLASVASSVDVGMHVWAVFVKNGHATADQEAKVRLAYTRYQLAMQVALSTYQAAYNTKDDTLMTQIITAVKASSDDLLELVQSFSTQ